MAFTEPDEIDCQSLSAAIQIAATIRDTQSAGELLQKMVRFIIRLFAVVLAAVAVLYVVVDTTRSLGASSLVFTSFRTSWQSVSPEGPDAAASWLAATFSPIVADLLFAPILACPTSIVFAAFSLFLFVLVHKRDSTLRPGQS